MIICRIKKSYLKKGKYIEGKYFRIKKTCNIAKKMIAIKGKYLKVSIKYV